MRRLHFDTLKPICPTCRRGALVLEPGAESTSNTVNCGILRCLDAACGQRFPIIAGVPVLVPDVGAWLSANLPFVLARDVADAAVEAVIGAAVGPGTVFNIARKQQSRYAHDHYGDAFDDAPSFGATAPGSAGRCLREALRHPGSGRGPRLDIGCATGRISFDLAATSEVPVLGVDVRWPLLRVGRGILDHGVLRYPLRRFGNTYERRETYLFPPGADRVDFWIADARSLPFAANTFRLAVALDGLHGMPDPARVIGEISRVTRPGGDVAFAMPLPQRPRAASSSALLAPADGSSDEDPDASAGMIAEASRATPGAKPLTPTGPPLNLPWSVRLHDTATVTFRSRLTTMMAAAD
ncbi:MAG: methyltransferase domain-containing protein [Parafilimonas terrae]|nr:methyltransferase domain-containing protein [Parafilimonas terrae]